MIKLNNNQIIKDIHESIDEHKTATENLFDQDMKEYKEQIETLKDCLEEAKTCIKYNQQEAEDLRKAIQERDKHIAALLDDTKVDINVSKSDKEANDTSNHINTSKTDDELIKRMSV